MRIAESEHEGSGGGSAVSARQWSAAALPLVLPVAFALAAGTLPAAAAPAPAPAASETAHGAAQPDGEGEPEPQRDAPQREPRTRARRAAALREEIVRLGYRIGRELEVEPLEEAPAWAESEGEPAFRFCQLSDLHLNAEHRAAVLAALDFVRERLRPEFVLLTGDNVSAAPGSIRAAHAELRALLGERLGSDIPWHAIKGDNDARAYEDVLGSSDWRFDFGGVRFVGIGLDVDLEGDGVGLFLRSRWLREQLRGARGRPAIVLLHEPVFPPCFLSAPRLHALLAGIPEVVALASGHLHLDLDFDVAGLRTIVAPAAGFGERRGIKEWRVFRDHVTIHTWEWLEAAGGGGGEGAAQAAGYRFADKWQRIDFPNGIRIPDGAPRAFGAWERTIHPTRFADPAVERARGAIDALRRWREHGRQRED